MSAPLNELQAAIYTRLTGFAALTSLLATTTSVYDHVPQNAVPPYVVIGDDTLNEDGTKTANGWDCTLTIHCWDFEKAGRKSVKAIMNQIFSALHRQESSVTVTGFSLVNLICEFQQTFQDLAAEGAVDHYYHGVQRFRALIKP